MYVPWPYIPPDEDEPFAAAEEEELDGMTGEVDVELWGDCIKPLLPSALVNPPPLE